MNNQPNKSGNNANNKKSNNRRRFYNKSNNNQNNGNSTNNSNNNKKKNFFKRKTHAIKQGGMDYITTKYLNLLDQHIQARRKYFENFDKVTGHTLEKLEQNFIESQKIFLAFREKLSKEDLEKFDAHFGAQKLDTTYSSNHSLAQDAYVKDDSEITIDDPHLLESQKRSAYSEDTEESVGSIEDYKSYKGL